jgi:histidinol-phosphate aminotransferase
VAWLERLVRKALTDVEPYRPGKPISDVQRELGLREIVRLCSNENPWPIPEAVSAAIQSAAKEVNRYPDPGAYYLKRALARKWGVSPSEIIVGAGTEGVVYALFQAIIDEGDHVVHCTPTYPLHILAAKAAGATCVAVPLTDTFTPTADMITAACSERTKVVIICNPNNPTGTIMSRSELLSLAAHLEGMQTLLVVDEAYAEYVIDPRYVSGVELFRQLGNIVILRTFSKIYGLAALRIGYGIAPKPVVESFSKVKRFFEVNKIAQHAAVAALEQTAYIEEIRDRTLMEREKMVSVLSDLGVKVYPTHTNFLLLRVEDADLVAEDLLREGIIVRPGSDMGMKGFLRVSIGLPEENERFAASLRKVMKRAGRR